MIVIEYLSKRFGDVVALRDLELGVEAGETLGVIGRNGAGRTTLLAILATLIRPTSGRVTVDGLDLATQRTRIRRRIGYLPQTLLLDEALTVREHLEFTLRARAGPGAGSSELESALAWTDLPPAKRLDRLTEGQRRILALAEALVHRPPVALLDEPLSQLDPVARLRVSERLLEHRRRGSTAILALSRIGDAQRLCSRLAVLDAGRLAGTLDMPQAGDTLEDSVRSLMGAAAEPAPTAGPRFTTGRRSAS